MKAKFTFSDCWDDLEVEFFRNTELEFIPPADMQFNFEPHPFELFVDTVTWYPDEGLLIVIFDYPHHESKEGFIASVRKIIAQNDWEYRANQKGAEIIDKI